MTPEQEKTVRNKCTTANSPKENDLSWMAKYGDFDFFFSLRWEGFRIIRKENGKIYRMWFGFISLGLW